MKAATKACAYQLRAPSCSSCTSTYSSRSKDILSKDDSLGLNNKEVDELVGISNHVVESLTGNGVVSTRANLSSQAIVEYDLANNLGEDGHTKDHPRNLESPSEDIQVSGSKNKGDSGHVGNTGSSCFTSWSAISNWTTDRARLTRVVPRQELREKGVVVSERLASGSGSRGSASSSSQVGELVGSLLSVVVDVLRNGACERLR